MKLKTTIVYKNTEEAYKKGFSTILHQGGSRSSKTYNILIWLILKAMREWNGWVIDIVRETLTSLRASAMFDFFKILEDMKVYSPDFHDKTNNTYKIGSNIFRFFGADEDQKVRGPGRNVLFVNEINGIKYSTYKQLNQRCTNLTIGDYNPSDEFHWIYDNLLTDKSTAFFKTTFRDNPFLPDRIIKEIKKYKKTDPNYWRIYGLGERGVAQSTIYPSWDYLVGTYEKFEGEEFFGMDFGFNDPTALVRVKYHLAGIAIDQLIYQSELTSDKIIEKLLKLEAEKKITKYSIIIADNARPEIIEDIRRAGFNIHPSKKGKDSLLRGINFLKKHLVYMTKESLDLAKEARSYKWKVDKNEKVLDEPVDVNNHLMDATRYALERKSNVEGFSVRTG